MKKKWRLREDVFSKHYDLTNLLSQHMALKILQKHILPLVDKMYIDLAKNSGFIVDKNHIPKQITINIDQSKLPNLILYTSANQNTNGDYFQTTKKKKTGIFKKLDKSKLSLEFSQPFNLAPQYTVKSKSYHEIMDILSDIFVQNNSSLIKGIVADLDSNNVN